MSADRASPVLPSADLERTARFYRHFGFEAVHRDDHWLTLRRDGVELNFALSSFDYAAPENLLAQPLAIIRVADVAAWHESFASTRMRWTGFGSPSLRSIDSAVWGRPAFGFTDKDGNLVWVVQALKD